MLLVCTEEGVGRLSKPAQQMVSASEKTSAIALRAPVAELWQLSYNTTMYSDLAYGTTGAQQLLQDKTQCSCALYDSGRLAFAVGKAIVTECSPNCRSSALQPFR